MNMKIIINENHFKMIKENLENKPYSKVVGIYVSGGIYDLKFNGKEIDDFSAREAIKLTYDIEVHKTESSIESISVTNIRGPEKIKFEVKYYDDEQIDVDGINYDVKREVIEIPIDWSILSTYKSKGDSYTIDDTLQVWIDQNEKGELVVVDMELETYFL